MKVRVKDDEIFLKKLGERISTLRKEKGLSQVELSYLVDIEKTNMNRIEKGNTNMTVLMLRKVCESLDISLKELLNF